MLFIRNNRFVQRIFDCIQEHRCGILIFFRIRNVVGGLRFADLLTDIVHGGLHQRIHGGNGIIQIYKRHRANVIFIHYDLHIQRLPFKGD